MGVGCPYTVTYELENGGLIKIKGIQTWQDTAPDVGHTMSMEQEYWDYYKGV